MRYRHPPFALALIAIIVLLMGAPPATHAVHVQPDSRQTAPQTPILAASQATHQVGTIHGHVVVHGAAAGAAAYIQALQGFRVVREERIDPDGTYELRDLSPGAYMLAVVDQQRQEFKILGAAGVNLAPGEVRTLMLHVSATAVSSLIGLAATPAADIAVAACASGGGTATIAGTVTSADGGTPLPNVAVYIYTPGGSSVAGRNTDAAGFYSVNNLAPGSYLVFFDTRSTGTAYMSEWNANQRDQAHATPVTASNGATTTVNAALDKGAQITGRVTAADGGAPLQSVQVIVYDSARNFVASAYTNVSGVYTTTPGLFDGSYKVFFKSPGGKPYLDEYYNDKPDFASSDAVSVTAPNLRSGVDAVLARGGQITGRVTAADTGAGLSAIVVGVFSASGDHIGSSYTDSGGYYTTTVGLATGSYVLSFAPLFETSPYKAEYYNNKDSYATADKVAVIAPTTVSNVNAVLEIGARISGHVTDTGGAPLQSVVILVWGNNGEYQNYVYTDASGNYSASGLPSGTYTLFFRKDGYLSEVYNDKPDMEQADYFTLTAPNALTNLDAVLARGGSITGKVTAADTGMGLKDVFVEALDQRGSRVESVFTDSTGTYTMPATLPGGAYRVRFTPDYRGVSCAYVPEYYNGALTLETSTAVGVAAPNMTPNINAVLSPGSAIGGRVTNAAGEGITDVYVQVYDASGERVADGRTNEAGNYTTSPALPSGSYRVAFRPLQNSGPYIGEYYNDKPTLAASDPIVITAPTDATGIDATLSKGGVVSGTVKAADSGSPLQYVYATIYDSSGQQVAYGETDENGQYTTAPGLPGGSYRVQFQTYSAYLSEYYHDKPTLAAADPVAVSASATTGGIDALLSRGGSIAGRVTVADTGAGLPSVSIEVYGGDGRIIDYGGTDAGGNYTIDGLPTGSYRVRFVPYNASAAYAGAYYNNRQSLATADAVNVSAPSTVTGIDAALVKGSRISGRIVDESGAPLPVVDVEVLAGDGTIVATGTSGSTGTYITAPAVPNGSYAVRFVPESDGLLGQYIPEYYDDQATAATATPIVFTTPTARSGIDAMLARGARLSGQVVAPAAAAANGSSGAALGQPGVQIDVYDATGAKVAAAETNDLGIYTTSPGLRTGTYRIGFTPPAGSPFVPSFYHGKVSLASADPVSVVAPELKRNLDDTLSNTQRRGIYLPMIVR